ncbi:MAG: ABC transporter substrate-binding protein [Firmicutes bacterium]|nr:ABC transporter substrate-binding protein [Bacillota bacterium]
MRSRLEIVTGKKAMFALSVLLVAVLASAALARTDITFWHVWDGARLPLIEQVVQDFEAAHPDIKVNAELVSQQGLMEKYLTAIAGGLPPDVIQVNASFLHAFAGRGVLLELDPYMDRDSFDPYAVFYPSEYEAFTLGGRTYSLPLDVSGSYLLFWDKDQAAAAGLNPAQAPVTWNELEAFAEKLTVANPDGSFERIGFNPAAISNNPFLVWLYLNNGRAFSQDERHVSFDSSEGIEAMEWLVGFADRLYGGFPSILGYLGDATSNGWHVTGLFYTGQVAAHISGVWHFAQLDANAPTKNYGVAVLPHNSNNPNARLCQPVSGGWGYAIPKDAAHYEEAWEFIKYATAGKGSLDFFLAQKRPSAVPVVNDDPRFAESNPHWDVVLETLEHREQVPSLPIQPQILDTIKQMTELAIRKGMSPKEALAWGSEGVQRILDDYWK